MKVSLLVALALLMTARATFNEGAPNSARPVSRHNTAGITGESKRSDILSGFVSRMLHGRDQARKGHITVADAEPAHSRRRKSHRELPVPSNL